jgi:GT2 family glycosyltransferase
MKSVSIVVPVLLRNQHTFKLTNDLLSGLLKTHGINNAEILVVDDGSDAKWIDALKKLYPNIVSFLAHTENKGFAAAVNTGINASKNEWVLLLNNDVQILKPDWLTHFIGDAEKNSLDVAAPKESWLDADWQYIPDAHRHCCSPSFKYPVGWALLVDHKVFQEVGILPLEFKSGFWEDTLWAWKIQTSYPQFKIGVVSGIDRVKLFHKEHQTFRAENIDLTKQYETNRALFLEFIAGTKTPTFPKLRS